MYYTVSLWWEMCTCLVENRNKVWINDKRIYQKLREKYMFKIDQIRYFFSREFICTCWSITSFSMSWTSRSSLSCSILFSLIIYYSLFDSNRQLNIFNSKTKIGFWFDENGEKKWAKCVGFLYNFFFVHLVSGKTMVFWFEDIKNKLQNEKTFSTTTDYSSKRFVATFCRRNDFRLELLQCMMEEVLTQTRRDRKKEVFLFCFRSRWKIRRKNNIINKMREQRKEIQFWTHGKSNNEHRFHIID